MSLPPQPMIVTDRHLSRSRFRHDVWAGLSEPRKRLSSKYLYDARGSRLFDEICELPEYYLTRTELAIMEADAEEMAAEIGPQAVLIEYGSGSSLKTRLLLDALEDPVAYVPVDISREHLEQSAATIADEYLHIDVLPVCADFTEEFEFPTEFGDHARRVVYFPGSTIGNFTPQRAQLLLSGIRRLIGEAGGLLLGFDFQKEQDSLVAAYDDAAGVTARFSLNLLRRINRELSADFDLSQFRHHATYNSEAARVEIEIVSLRSQTVDIAGRTFDFAAGESISTEYAHKYSIDGLRRLAASAELEVNRVWTDSRDWFGVALLTAAS